MRDLFGCGVHSLEEQASTGLVSRLAKKLRSCILNNRRPVAHKNRGMLRYKIGDFVRTERGPSALGNRVVGAQKFRNKNQVFPVLVQASSTRE